jgi:uncharacterized surface protein with fasciclin (FAS1) repeats
MLYVLISLAVLTTSAYAQDDPLEEALVNDPDATAYSRLIASLKLRADETKTVGTLFVPTDRAVKQFLGDMGMTSEELLARPQLVDSILSYHFVPGVSLRDFAVKVTNGQESLISSNEKEPSLLRTGDVSNNILIFRSSTTEGTATLIDEQGNKVSVIGKPTVFGKMVLWDVSNVLMSGQYFFNTRAAVRYIPEWSSFQELYQRASQASKSLETAFAGQSAYTYLLPSNDALKPAMQALSKAPTSDLAQLLEYHILPEMRPVPTGWKNGESVKTMLSGHNIKAQLGQSPFTDPFDGSTQQGPELTLVPEVGKPAKVDVMNVYAGKSILQGVSGALVPNTAVAKTLGAAAPATTTESGKTGRKLLQERAGSQQNNMWAMKNTQSAIRAAASGRTPASYATSSGSRNARVAGSRCVNCSWKF